MIGFNFKHISKVLQLLKFIPDNYNIVKRIFTSFNNLHFDKDTGIIHSLPASRVHELRGKCRLISLTEIQSIELIALAAAVSEEDTLLDVLMINYIKTMETRRKGQKKHDNFFKYFNWCLKDSNSRRTFDQKVLKK